MTSTPTYAVLFKTHAWDDFIERQLLRLTQNVRSGDIYVLVDETHQSVGDIPFPRVIRQTEDMVAAGGYRKQSINSLFWYNTDYPLYHFLEEHPDYDYYLNIEYDCFLNFDIGLIIDRMERDSVDFVSEHIKEPFETWGWSDGIRPFHEPGLAMQGRLLCFSIYSRAFLHALQEARRDHTRRRLEGHMPAGAENAWPISEAFVGGEIARLGANTRTIGDYVDVSRYDWAPAFLESALSLPRAPAISHPVLDSSRYLAALRKIGWDLDQLYVQNSGARRHLEHIPVEQIVRLMLEHMARSGDWEKLDMLRRYAEERIGRPAPEILDVAFGKPATQSTISPWSHFQDVAQDASGAISGRTRNGYSFHTHATSPSWWLLDLKALYPVREIRIQNRVDHQERARSLIISASADLIEWQTLHRHAEHPIFGSSPDDCLVLSCSPPISLRFLRVSLEEPQLLNLGQIRVLV